MGRLNDRNIFCIIGNIDIFRKSGKTPDSKDPLEMNV